MAFFSKFYTKTNLLSLFFVPFLIFTTLKTYQSSTLASSPDLELAASNTSENTKMLAPFPCAPDFYHTFEGGNIGTYDLGNFSGGFNVLGSLGFSVNATGYNPDDGFLYSIRKPDLHLIRIHNDGSFDDLGDLGGLPIDPVVGGFDDSGAFFVKDGTGNIYRIDVEHREAHFVLQGSPRISGYDGDSCPGALPPFPVVCAHHDTICVSITGQASVFIHDNDMSYQTALDFNSYTQLIAPSFGNATYNTSTGELTYTAFGKFPSPPTPRWLPIACGDLFLESKKQRL